MALFIWMEKYVSICVIAWVIVPLPTRWKAYIISTILLHWLLWSIPETDRILPARIERPGWSSRVKFILMGRNVTVHVQPSQIQRQIAQLLCFRDTVSIPVCPSLFFTFHYKRTEQEKFSKLAEKTCKSRLSS